MRSDVRLRPGDSSFTVAPKVYRLAQLVYQEFDHLQRTHGEDATRNLLQLNVRLLEDLNQLYNENRQLELDLSVQSANEHDLSAQNERLRAVNRSIEQHAQYMEDELLSIKDENQKTQDKLEAIVRYHELLSRNASEHANRLEEREKRLQDDLALCQERYNELLRSHVGQLDRFQRLSAKHESGGRSHDNAFDDHRLPRTPSDASIGQSRFAMSTADHRMYQSTFSDSSAAITSTTPGLIKTKLDSSPSASRYSKNNQFSSTIKVDSSHRRDPYANMFGDSVDYEFAFISDSLVDKDDDSVSVDAHEIKSTDDCDEDHIPASLIPEVESLIRENVELTETKNALNVVKDDLIRNLDELTSENQLLSKQVESLTSSRNQAQHEVNQLSVDLTSSQHQISLLSARLDLLEKPSTSTAGSTSSLLPHSTTTERYPPRHVSRSNSLEYLARQQSTSCYSDDTASTLRSSQSTFAAGGPSHRHQSNHQQRGRRNHWLSEESLTPKTQRPTRSDASFSNREVARLISERNYFKEALLELQEMLEYARGQTNPVNDDRSERDQPVSSSSSISSFFANLFDQAASDFRYMFSPLSLIGSADRPRLMSSRPREAQSAAVINIGNRRDNRFGSRFASSSTRSRGSSSEISQMFGHLLGQTAVYGAANVLSNGNDLVAETSSQSFARLFNSPFPSLFRPLANRPVDSHRLTNPPSTTQLGPGLYTLFNSPLSTSSASIRGAEAVSTTSSQQHLDHAD